MNAPLELPRIKKAPGSYGIPGGQRIPRSLRERLDDGQPVHPAGGCRPDKFSPTCQPLASASIRAGILRWCPQRRNSSRSRCRTCTQRLLLRTAGVNKSEFLSCVQRCSEPLVSVTWLPPECGRRIGNSRARVKSCLRFRRCEIHSADSSAGNPRGSASRPGAASISGPESRSESARPGFAALDVGLEHLEDAVDHLIELLLRFRSS